MKRAQKGQAMAETVILLGIFVLLYWGVLTLIECHDHRYKVQIAARYNAWCSAKGKGPGNLQDFMNSNVFPGGSITVTGTERARREYEPEILKIDTGVKIPDENKKIVFEDECVLINSRWRFW
ncbi:MAG: hypothetical protein QME49_02605 [bacterium]|nr:hypothetical protein [bacterium]